MTVDSKGGSIEIRLTYKTVGEQIAPITNVSCFGVRWSPEKGERDEFGENKIIKDVSISLGWFVSS